MLLAIDSDEHFIDEEGIAVVLMLSFQSAGIKRSKLYEPQPDGLTAEGNTKIFNIAVTQIESALEPDGITNDLWKKSTTLVGIHPPILSRSASLSGSTVWRTQATKTTVTATQIEFAPAKTLACSSSGFFGTSSPRKALARRSTFRVFYVHGSAISQLDREEISCLDEITDSSVPVVNR